MKEAMCMSTNADFLKIRDIVRQCNKLWYNPFLLNRETIEARFKELSQGLTEKLSISYPMKALGVRLDQCAKVIGVSPSNTPFLCIRFRNYDERTQIPKSSPCIEVRFFTDHWETAVLYAPRAEANNDLSKLLTLVQQEFVYDTVDEESQPPRVETERVTKENGYIRVVLDHDYEDLNDACMTIEEDIETELTRAFVLFQDFEQGRDGKK